MNSTIHGVYATYSNGCRCDDCRSANASYVREARYRRVPPPASDPRHGTESCYKNHNCRCDPCRINVNAVGLEREKRNRPPARTPPAQAFFAEHVHDQTDECILWPFSKNNHGYGMFWFQGRRTTVHAAACEVWHGPRPDGMETNHSCENRACFNGAHLRWGTHRENIDDRERSRVGRLVSAVALATVALLGIGSGIASAHTPSVVASCSGLSVSLVAYEQGQGALNNRVTTTIDGTATVANFGASYVNTFTWSQTTAHAWSVVIDANRQTGNATQYDRTFSGTQQACQTPPTTTVAPTTTTVPVTTTTQPAVTTTAPAVTTTEPPTTSTDPTPLDTVPVNTIVFDIGTPLVPQCPYNPALTVDSSQCVVILPQTGGVDWGLVGIAFAMICVGFASVRVARRRVP